MILAIDMDKYPTLSDESPPDGWNELMDKQLCPYVLKDIVKLYHEYGFDLYLHNVNNIQPTTEFDDVRVKIYFKKKKV